jgi:hypothetical protein
VVKEERGGSEGATGARKHRREARSDHEEMTSRSGRGSRLARALAVAALAVAGCGGTTNGVPDAKIIAALNMKRVQGHYAIHGNPFCSVSALLHDSGQVSDASSTGRVIASRDGTVGIEIIRPFAPSCKRQAIPVLNRLAAGRPHPRHGPVPRAHREGGGGGG